MSDTQDTLASQKTSKITDITPKSHDKSLKSQSNIKPEVVEKPAKPNPVIKREQYYQKTSKYFNRALRVWVNGLRSKNEKVRLESANQIMSRIVPALKGIELTGANGEPIKQYQIIVGNGFIPPNLKDSIAIEAIEDNKDSKEAI